MILSFYSKVVVGISFDGDTEINIVVAVKNMGNMRIIENRKFFIENNNLSKSMENYINSFFIKYHYVYVSIMLSSKVQISIPKCNVNISKYLNVAIGKLTSLCVSNRYNVSVYEEEITGIKRLFKNVGIDFIISPITVFDFFCRQIKKINDDIVLYVLFQNSYMLVMIYKKNKLLFSKYNNIVVTKNIETNKNKSTNNNSMEDDNIGRDDIADDDESEFDIEELDDDVSDLDMDDANDMDSIDDVIDDSDSFDDNELFKKNQELLIGFIQQSLEDFYTNKIYTGSDFVSSMVLSSDDMLEDICPSIQKSLLLDTTFRKIKMSNEFCRLSMLEIEHAL
jgi:hypothetical protein